MARRPNAGRAAADRRAVAERAIDAALRLAAERDWPSIGMADIAAAAGVSLGDLYAAFPSRAAVLGGLMARTDAAMLAGEGTPAEPPAAPDEGEGPMDGEPQPVESATDRLFDLLMRRLETLEPHRPALARIMRSLPRDPVTALCGAPRLMRAMAWTLEAAGLRATGLRGLVRAQALAAAYLATARVWIGDESEDLARTMAALDRNLRRIGRIVGA